MNAITSIRIPKILFCLINTIGLLIIFNNNSMACNCNNVTSFWELYDKSSNKKDIVKIVKLDDYYWGMHAKVIEKNEESEAKDTIIIWGINTMSCRWSRTNEFKNGDTLLYLLSFSDLEGNGINQESDTSSNIEKEGDYMLENCACNILSIRNGFIYGHISDHILELPIDSFYNLISQPYVNILDIAKREKWVEVYPNPVTSSVTIQKNTNNNVFLKIYDLTGSLILSKSIKTNISRINLEAIDRKSMLFVFFYDNEKIYQQLILKR